MKPTGPVWGMTIRQAKIVIVLLVFGLAYSVVVTALMTRNYQRQLHSQK